MLSRYFSGQSYPELVGGSKGINVSIDLTLPYQSNRWICPNYLFHRQEILTPINSAQTFVSGQSDPIRFTVSTAKNIVCHLNEI